MTLSTQSRESLPVSTKRAHGGCVAPSWARKPERSEASGLVGLKEQSDPNTVHVLHADAQLRRLRRMRLVVKGAAMGIQSSLTDNGFRFRVGFGTLTYRDDVEWEPNHIRDCMRQYRKWFKRRSEPFRCVWVAETTKRGRVHYHFVFWLRKGLTPPLPDKQGWWKHGSSKMLWARKPVGYIVKYSTKGDSESPMPKGLRLYGVSGPTGNLGWFRAPMWARKRWRTSDKIMKKDGFWNNYTLGIGLRSPWVYASSDENGLTLRYVGWSCFDVQFCNWE